MVGARRALAGLFALLLVACSHNAPVVAESKVVKKAGIAKAGAAAGAPAPASGQQYTVVKGDTLYSIAFRYGIDFKTLAALNGIHDPYVIHPGQVLVIKSRGQPLVARPRAPVKPAVSVPAVSSTPVKSSPPAPAGKAVEPAPTRPTASPAAPVPAAVSADKTAPAGPVATRFVGGGHWQWPAQGRLLAKFTNSGVGPKGIAVGGNPGDPVRAARDGKVVYTGGSLVGYGQLVIVKHDEVYLSAYAHNRRVLVREGESVKAGQRIAEMGSTGTDRTKLHFEVRRNGDPVDPLSVLPAI